MKKLVLTLLLGAAPLCAQNPQIPVTGNLGAGGNFPAICTTSILFPSDANYTPTYPAMACSSGVMIVHSAVSLTAARNLVLPVTQGFNWKIENLTTGGQGIQVIGPSGAGVTIANGTATVVLADGTNYVSASGGGGSSGFPITLGSTSVAASSTTTAVTGLTIDGVSPTTMGFVDPTSSVQTQLNTKAPLASPALTGTPTAPTAAPGTNTTQLATTAFVLANAGSSSPLTTKGDLYGFSTTNARFAVGTNGQHIIADSTQATGLNWASANPITSFDQIVECSGAVSFNTKWGIYDNNAPAGGCVNTATTTEGYAAFINAPSASQYLQNSSLTLPPYWTQTNFTIYYYSTVTTGTVELEVETACPGTTYTVGSPTWSSPATQTVTVPGTAGNWGTATFTSIAANSTNGCPAANTTTPSPLYVRFFRGTSDTAAAAANVVAVMLTQVVSQ